MKLNRKALFLLYIGCSFQGICTTDNTQNLVIDIPSQGQPSLRHGHKKPQLKKLNVKSVPLQSAQTALGFFTTFENNNLTYPDALVAQDPRYLALENGLALLDAIKFADVRSNQLFLILFSIKKGPNNVPLVGVMKSPVLHVTKLQGIVMQNPQTGNIMYYSGFLMQTPLWQSLYPGQSLLDSYCQSIHQSSTCAVQDTKKIVLHKSDDPMRNLPVLLSEP